MKKITQVRIVKCKGKNSKWGFIPQGMSQDGYGDKIHTQYQIKLEGSRWYQVYLRIYSNIGSLFISDKEVSGSDIEDSINEYKEKEN